MPGAIDLDDWLERPAGKRGGVRIVKDRFAFADGTPVKFWGTNLSYTASAPDKETAEFTAARFAKYGINAVRMHKFSYPTGQSGIGDPNDSTKMDLKGLDRLDYFSAKLKERGVYFGWSHTYGFKVVSGDRKRLLAYDEIAKNLQGNTYAFINFAEDVQDLMIEMVINLLKHKNPHTGLTYAEEPALCFIELQNEDDKRALISVMARSSNTGFSYFRPDNRVLKNGGPPILLEPVKAAVTIAGREVEAVHVLDHDGKRTGRTLPVTGGRFTLDGSKDKAVYYEVLFR